VVECFGTQELKEEDTKSLVNAERKGAYYPNE
jgi:hypothetical protein